MKVQKKSLLFILFSQTIGPAQDMTELVDKFVVMKVLPEDNLVTARQGSWGTLVKIELLS